MGHIFLYGPPGAGKTVLGKALAAHFNLPFTDLDSLIESRSGHSIAQIFEKEGEIGFRDRESEALREVTQGKEQVIALGGGALLRPENRTLAEQSGTILFLDVPSELLLSRLRNDSNARPLLAGNAEEKLKNLLEARQEHYASFPTRIGVNNDNVAHWIQQAQIALGRFRLHKMGEYEARLETGGLKHLGDVLTQSGLRHPVVVSDEHVAPIYAETVLQSLRQAGFHPSLLVLPPGEEHKTLRSIEHLWQGFLQAGLNRHSTVIALGGGVIGDLTGFAAATYMRGVAWVNLPTTLLAMVDASLGGKTGFDLPEGKNLIGAFHPPKWILADPTTLATLPEAEFRAGLAEVVKHGVIADAHLFALCGQGIDTIKKQIGQVLRQAMAVKIAIIEADPFEQHERAFLNFGHTIGHAIEQVSGFRLRHGEAVAMGMVLEARLAERLGLATTGLAETISQTLRILGLPTQLPSGMAQKDILRAMQVDKKKTEQTYRFALPIQIGQMELVEIKNLEIVLQEAA